MGKKQPKTKEIYSLFNQRSFSIRVKTYYAIRNIELRAIVNKINT